ncbi:MAG: hypothetical protein GTO45_16500 [Candidatus Aminicenantes bacterium]|nr:hypothetical protein [Candidatus Aminicenantes bacterium]NIM78302.1 hypothetical protein [Candidatus Aminicenantes bacterium]NIN19728.1 hypothetical protein [Candidatus Aminicenantes bacterium]NIN43610.1 hypothetical protein [Candidatus Aminicenantes bacterium]NIN86355.1 hypothetical protein [Candidatus Aminicenantes bacterium]
MKTIGIFKSNCPPGWTRLSAWDGKFLRGSPTYGGTGGDSQHYHTVNYPATTTTQVAANAKPLTGINSPPRYYVPHTHIHTLDIAEGNSSYAEYIPLCIDVVFCYLED